MISNLEIKNEEDADIQQHVHNKESEVVAVGQDHRIMKACEELRDLLSPVIRRLQYKQLLHRHEIENLNHGLLHIAQKRFITSPPSNFSREEILSVQSDFNAAIFVLRACHNLERGSMNGPIQTLQNAKTECMSKYGAKGDIVRKEGFSRVLNNLSTLRDQESFLHPKVQKLKDILEQHFHRKPTECSMGSDTWDSRAIVFASSRDCVEEICEEINKLQNVRASIFIGQQGTASHKGQSQRIQQEVMNDFRNGRFNTIVSEVVIERSRYDLVNSPIRDVQRSGRTGRAREGMVVQLVMEGREALEHMQSAKKKSSLTKTLKSLTQCKKIDLYKHDLKLVDPLPPVVEVDFHHDSNEHSVTEKEAPAKDGSKARAKKGRTVNPMTKEEKIAWMKGKGYHVDISCFYASQDLYSLKLDSWPELQAVSTSVYRIQHNRRCRRFVSMMSKFFESQIACDRSGADGLQEIDYANADQSLESFGETHPTNVMEIEEIAVTDAFTAEQCFESKVPEDCTASCFEADSRPTDSDLMDSDMCRDIERYFPALEAAPSPPFYSGRDRIPVIPDEFNDEQGEVARRDVADWKEENENPNRVVGYHQLKDAAAAFQQSPRGNYMTRSPTLDEKLQRSEFVQCNVPEIRSSSIRSCVNLPRSCHSEVNQQGRETSLVHHSVCIPSFDLGDSSGGEESESLQCDKSSDVPPARLDAPLHLPLEFEVEIDKKCQETANADDCREADSGGSDRNLLVVSENVRCDLSIDRSDVSTPLVKIRKKRRRIVSSEEEEEDCNENSGEQQEGTYRSSVKSQEEKTRQHRDESRPVQIETISSSEDEFERNPRFPQRKPKARSGADKAAQKKGKGQKQSNRRMIRAKYFEDEAEQSEDHLTSSGDEKSIDDDQLPVNDSFINDEASESCSEASPGAMRRIYARSLMTQEEGGFEPAQRQGRYKMAFGRTRGYMMGRERSVSESDSEDSDLSSFVVGSSQEIEEEELSPEEAEVDDLHQQDEPEDLCSPASRPPRVLTEEKKARFFVAGSEFNSRLCQELRKPHLSNMVECVSTTRLQSVSYACGMETAMIRKHLKDLKSDEQLSSLAQQISSAKVAFDNVYLILDTASQTAFALDPLKVDMKRYMEVVSCISRANGVQLLVSDDPASLSLTMIELALQGTDSGVDSPSSSSLEYIRGLSENPVLHLLSQFPFLNLLHAAFIFDQCPCLKDLCELTKRKEAPPPLSSRRWNALREWLWNVPEEKLQGAARW
eukprot:757734-Hanusia_phi.AAC.6